MKIKKISLRNMSDTLTDNEMKNVVGGGYVLQYICYYGQSLHLYYDHSVSDPCNTYGEICCKNYIDTVVCGC